MSQGVDSKPRVSGLVSWVGETFFRRELPRPRVFFVQLIFGPPANHHGGTILATRSSAECDGLFTTSITSSSFNSIIILHVQAGPMGNDEEETPPKEKKPQL